jgi:hypothetical protein
MDFVIRRRLCPSNTVRRVTIVRNPIMKRKHWIIAALILALLLLVCARMFQARSYMQQQIERLAKEGYSGYKISGCDPLRYSDDGRYMCITIKAQRMGDTHIIEIDFPWNPLNSPMHRI